MELRRTKRSVKKGNSFAFILITFLISIQLMLPSLVSLLKLNVSSSTLTVAMHVICFVIPTIIYFIVTKEPAKEVLRVNKINLKTSFLIILLALLMYPVIIFLNLISQLIFPNLLTEMISDSSQSMSYFAFIMMIGVMPSITEEITLRGVILSNYDAIDVKKAAIVTGVFFGALHLNGNQFFYVVAMGILMAYLVRITNSIFSSVLLHFTINTVSGTISFFSSRAMQELGEVVDTTSLPGQLGIGPMIMAVIVWGIIALLFFKLIKKVVRYLDKVNGNRVFGEKEAEYVDNIDVKSVENVDGENLDSAYRAQEIEEFAVNENKYIFNWAFYGVVIWFVLIGVLPYIFMMFQ